MAEVGHSLYTTEAAGKVALAASVCDRLAASSKVMHGGGGGGGKEVEKREDGEEEGERIFAKIGERKERYL